MQLDNSDVLNTTLTNTAALVPLYRLLEALPYHPMHQRFCVAAGTIEDTKWESVQVGQVLQVKDDELFPADLMCLYTALPDKVTPWPPLQCHAQHVQG